MAVLNSLLTWDDSPTGGSPITDYRALVFEGEELIETVTAGPDTQGLPIAHSATVDRIVLVQARNDLGWSAPVSVEVPLGTASDPVAVAPALSATAGNNLVTLTVTGGTYDAAVLLRDGVVLNTAATFPATDRSVANDTEYSYQVRVTLDGGEPVLSNSVSVTPLAAPAPTAPTITAVRSSSDPSQVTLTITEPGSATWINYAALVNNGVWTDPVTPPVTLTGLPSTALAVKLRATYRISGVNYTVDSNVVNVAAVGGNTLPAGVIAPTISVASVGERQAAIRLDTAGSGYATIQLEYRRDGQMLGYELVPAPISNGQEVSVYGLKPGEPSTIVAVVVYQAGGGFQFADGPSVTVTALGFEGQAPTLDAAPGDGQLTITLATPGSGYSTSTLYVLDNNAMEEQRTFQDPTFPFVVTGLTNGNSYGIVLQVSDENGYTDQSPFVEGVPAAVSYTLAQGGNFGPSFIQDAPLWTEDGVAAFSTVGKVATDNEAQITTLANNRVRVPAWFKFYLGVAATVRMAGRPSFLGYDGNTFDGANEDSFLMLFTATNGHVSDASILTDLTHRANADDEAGSGQPALSTLLQPGWYYVAMAGFSASQTVNNARLAFKDLPVGSTLPPDYTPPSGGGGGEIG